MDQCKAKRTCTVVAHPNQTTYQPESRSRSATEKHHIQIQLIPPISQNNILMLVWLTGERLYCGEAD